MSWLQSKYEGNTKRIIKKRELSKIDLEISEYSDFKNVSQIVGEIERISKKEKIEKSKILFKHHEEREYDEDTKNYIIFYYESPETDEEYAARISELEKIDLKKFVEVISSFFGYTLIKDQMKEMLNKHSNIRWADHQKDYIKMFFDGESILQKIRAEYDKGYKNGVEAGKKQMKEKLNNL